ncbi:presenilin enhancer 2 [Chloropicon primus]|uniref:Presenilin enhancer 2 n=1 Tax=Chloropicon primus TaxID=1764295 RepID=A0A5B8MMG5_9CHLO|nr:presenilin enhancer 2 [Chloropicon primus]UPQ99700.1 presenilin enhancer 2 [Chloropicon primus]|eukprot:QDZ20490.1 presenilin enhancer 2 [Chloropicon primus]
MARVVIENVDGEGLRRSKARALSRKLCVAGLFGVPFFWVVHLWYFWPEVRKPRGDAYIKRNAVGTMAAFSVVMLALVVWMFVYHVGGKGLLGDAFERLNISNVDLDALLQGG